MSWLIDPKNNQKRIDDDDDFRLQPLTVVIRIVSDRLTVGERRRETNVAPAIDVTGGLTGAATTAAGIVPEHWDKRLSILSQ